MGEVFIPDPLFNSRRLRKIYTRPDPVFRGVSGPVLGDCHTQTVVNSEAADIVRMFNSAFDGGAAQAAPTTRSHEERNLLNAAFTRRSPMVTISRVATT